MLEINNSWTLFLDRDGVINRKLENDYVKNFEEEFEFLPHVRESLEILRKIFQKIIVVTNQQGVGKGFMDEEDVMEIHAKMLYELHQNQMIIDEIYYCPSLASANDPNRKPEIGMAIQAKDDFAEIDFAKSLIIGDSISDMKFGRDAGMKTLLFSADIELITNYSALIDFTFADWISVTNFIIQHTHLHHETN